MSCRAGFERSLPISPAKWVSSSVTPRGSISNGENALAFRSLMYSLKTSEGKPPAVTGKPIVWADIITAMYVDGKKTTIAAFVTVFLLLLLFERSFVALGLILLPLGLGVAYTLGFMVLFGMKINFFIMLALPTIIGIGVDDGVHIYHRYRELGAHTARYVVRTTGMAAVLTSLTTSVGFGSLLSANLFGLEFLGSIVHRCNFSGVVYHTLGDACRDAMARCASNQDP